MKGHVDRSIPGEVRSWLGDNTGRKIADDARILHTGVTDRKKAKIALLVVLAITFGIAGYRLFQNRRERSTAAG